MHKGYIFDMDGTLVDSMPYLEMADEKLFEPLGIPYTKEASDHMRYTPVSESAAWMNRKYGLSITAEELIGRINDALWEMYSQVGPRPGALEFLEKAEKAGIKMCIATATPPDMASAVCTRLGITDKVDFLLSCDELGVTKSVPDVFVSCAERMGLSPSDIAVFEDGVPGIISSKKAGFFAVGMDESTMNDTDRRAIKENCDIFVPSFEGLELL